MRLKNAALHLYRKKKKKKSGDKMKEKMPPFLLDRLGRVSQTVRKRGALRRKKSGGNESTCEKEAKKT